MWIWFKASFSKMAQLRLFPFSVFRMENFQCASFSILCVEVLLLSNSASSMISSLFNIVQWGGGVRPAFKKFCAQNLYYSGGYLAIQIHIYRSSGGQNCQKSGVKLSKKIMTDWAFSPKNLCTILTNLCDRRLGKSSKTPVTENVRDGGGVPPFSVIFFPLTFWPAAFRDGGRY